MPRFAHADVGAITASLWTGGQFEFSDPRAADRQCNEAARWGLTHVIDVRIERNDRPAVSVHLPSVNYRWRGIEDAGQVVAHDWWEAATREVVDTLRASDSRVLVHCQMGINRGPSLAFASMLALGWDPVDALTAVRAARPQAAMLYAEGAIDWWLCRNGASNSVRRQTWERTDHWRSSNPTYGNQTLTITRRSHRS